MIANICPNRLSHHLHRRLPLVRKSANNSIFLILAARGDITLQRWDSFVQEREREREKERDGTRSNTEEWFHTSDMMCWAQNFDLYSTLSLSLSLSHAPFPKYTETPLSSLYSRRHICYFALYTSILTSHPTLRQSSHPHPSLPNPHDPS